MLTIDRSLQFATEQALLRQVAAVGARGARAIIQDPRTGDVLAMANVDIDPDTGQPVVSSANEALTAVFEPGSVNKVITASAAIEEGLVNPDTVLQVPDRLQVSDHLFSDHDPHAAERVVGDRHRHQVVEHRHDHDRPDAREGPHRRVPPQVRAR